MFIPVPKITALVFSWVRTETSFFEHIAPKLLGDKAIETWFHRNYMRLLEEFDSDLNDTELVS